MTFFFPGLLFFFLLPSQRLFMLHSKYVYSVFFVLTILSLYPMIYPPPQPAQMNFPAGYQDLTQSNDPAVFKSQLFMVPRVGNLLYSVLIPPPLCRTGDMSWLTGKGS